MPSETARRRMQELVIQSKRKTSVRLPQGFARQSDRTPYLSLILGHKGEVRLKLYLTILLRATRAPHSTQVNARDFAEVLDLDDADGAGARRVRKSLADLEKKLHVVKCERPPGLAPEVTILDPSGAGNSTWSDRELDRPYIGIPLEFWENGWIYRLNGRSVALLIVLIELTGGRKLRDGSRSHTAWADGIRKREYGLSTDTWTKATADLVRLGLLSVTSTKASSHGVRRRRVAYTLHMDVLKGEGPDISDPVS